MLDRLSKERHLSPHIVWIIILLMIGAIAYGLFYAPIIYNDDWSFMIGRWYKGTMTFFDLNELRPFQKAPFALLYMIFGPNIHIFYLVFWILVVTAAIQLYFLFDRLIKNKPAAFGIAAIYLIYPADFTHMWVSQIHNRLAVVLTLLYAHLLLVYRDTGHRRALWGSLISLLLSFTLYEGQFGVTMTWCLVMAISKKTSSRRDRLGLLWPVVVGLLFVLWRTAGYAVVGIEDSYEYDDRVQLTPLMILQRLVWGFQIMIWAWIEPVVNGLGLQTWQAVGGLVATMIVCAMLVALIIKHFRSEPRYLSHQQHSDQLRQFLLMLLIGPIFVAAGYVPFITVFQPTVIQFGSRINGFAILGASATIIALLAVIVLLFKRKQVQINSMVLATAFPLIFLGTVVQAQVQHDDRAAWQEQKRVWQQFFELVPDLQEGATVHFVFPEQGTSPSFNRNGQRPPLFASWDTTAALNVLYGRQNLRGDVSSKDVFLPQGIQNKYGYFTTPYHQAVVIIDDGDELRLAEDLAAEKLLDFPVTYIPYDHIIDTPTPHTTLRWLVGSEE